MEISNGLHEGGFLRTDGLQILDEIGSQFAVAGSVFFFDPDGAAGFEGMSYGWWLCLRQYVARY